MLRKILLGLGIVAWMLGPPGASAPARAEGGVKAGTLSCHVSSGWGFVFGSSRDLQCTYSPAPGAGERYTGKISKYGVDIGYQSGAVMVWIVIGPGALAGDYGGATGSASIGVGLGANVLVGGSKNSIALQPVSIEGNTGLNVAGGIGALTLRHEP
jgi:uncharacterized protein DUF992